MSDWPSVNSLAWLRLPCCNAEHHTRVEDVSDDGISVGWPVAPHTEPVTPFEGAQGFFVGWVIERGALEVPVVMTAHDNGAVPTWTLKSIGSPVETQRRAFVRISIEMDASLYVLEGGAPTPVKIVDLSEGGIRCRVDKWLLDPGGRIFTTELTVNEQQFFIPTQMAWAGTADEQGLRFLGLQFVNVDVAVSDALRSFVFNTQIEQRRQKLG